MTSTRGFEIVSKYKNDAKVTLPIRSTMGSAGYDFAAAEETVIPSIKNTLTSTLIPTGIKAFMPENEYLMLVNRSSSPMKRQLAMPNGIGIIDADYYGNAENEGEIFLQVVNYGPHDRIVKKGERICQGIFMPYLLIDDEVVPQTKRTGGFGSSGN